MPGQPAAPLKSWQKSLMKASVPVLLAMLTMGCLGLIVLMDKSGENWLSRSQFGIRWKALIEANPIFSMFFVNGSILCLLLIAHTLQQDAKIVQAVSTGKEKSGSAPAKSKPRRAKKAD